MIKSMHSNHLVKEPKSKLLMILKLRIIFVFEFLFVYFNNVPKRPMLFRHLFATQGKCEKDRAGCYGFVSFLSFLLKFIKIFETFNFLFLFFF